MDPELKKLLEELKGQVGKSVDAAAQIDQIVARVAAGEQQMTVARAELEKVMGFVKERDQALKELREQTRVQAVSRDPIARKQQALEMMGMIARAAFFRRHGVEHPSEFRGEVEIVRKYQEEVLARATLTPMSTTGSYVVPTVTDMSIQDAVEEVSELMSMVDFMPGLPAGGTFNYTFLATRPSMKQARATTDTTRTQSDPVFAQLQLTPKEMYVTFPVDNKFFVMSPLALGQYFQGLCRDAMIDKMAYWLLRADGTSTYNSITGLLNETRVDYVNWLPAGKTSFKDITAKDINDAKSGNLKRGRGPRARWVMDLDVQGVIEEIDRTGKVPLLREMPDGSYRLKGNDLVIEEYMPGLDEDAKDTGFALFGDLATAIIAMVGGMRVRSDSSVGFKEDQTWFAADTVATMARKPVKTLKLIKTAKA